MAVYYYPRSVRRKASLVVRSNCLESFESQILVETLDGTLPHEYERVLVHDLDAVVDEFDGVPEHTDKVSKGRMHLRLGGR